MAGRTTKIPRDVECWYCRKGQHSRCSLGLTCACYTCFTTGRLEGDDELSQQASYYTPEVRS